MRVSISQERKHFPNKCDNDLCEGIAVGNRHLYDDAGICTVVKNQSGMEGSLSSYAKTTTRNVPQKISQPYLLDEAVVEAFQKTEKATSLEAAFSIRAEYVEHIKHTYAKMFM